MSRIIENSNVLVTGGAGFIGSNLVEALLGQNNKVVVLDNFATGKRENIEPFLSDKNFTLIEGDIRNLEDCKRAVEGMEYVLHQAALGSVPRSINDPITSNDVNVSGFLNMLVAVRDAGVKRMVYAASSSTYGDHPGLPKLEEKIGKPLSPYAVTKYVNELYADVFAKTYGMEIIGLRYFNVFGKRQDPFGAYAAVIPLFVKALINHESPIVNGDGTHSRDFTYIDNVVQMNQLAATTKNPDAINTVYNTAQGQNTNLNELITALKENLHQFDAEISTVDPTYREERQGDVKHSLADISKAQNLMDYQPTHNVEQGIKEAIEWYWNYFNKK